MTEIRGIPTAASTDLERLLQGRAERRAGGPALPSVRMAVTEASVLLAATLVSQVIRFGTGPNGVELGFAGVDYTTFSVILTGLWVALLVYFRAGRARDAAFGAPNVAYQDITRSSGVVVVVVAMYSGLAQAEISRGYLLGAIPLGFAVLVLDRVLWRTWVRAQRRRGRYTSRAVLVGNPEDLRGLASLMGKDPGAGIGVVGVVSVGGEPQRIGDPSGVRFLPSSDVAEVQRAARAFTPDVVVVVSDGSLGDDFVREMSWSLEDSRIRLFVSPRVGPVSSDRLQTIPVAGHQLISVESARYSGMKYVAKRSLDIGASLAALVVLWPLFAVVAMCVRADSDGPALFRQERIGHRGRRFTMLKFRTMRIDAETIREDLVTANDHTTGPLFKLRSDPRVTRVGRFLRRYSIDELPQLVNVLRGEMSLVGPRPPLPREVDAYVEKAHRRLLSKPGLTGPWQVSGRSDLDWEDGLLLDLLYVENWSFLGDVVILVRTIGAVVAAKGAY